jgi:uncharacterized protein with HEPN domain
LINAPDACGPAPPRLAGNRECRAFLAGKSETDFARDQLLRLAVERSLEIISEASRRIPADVKARETQISWQRMADLGNFLRHAYHDVNPETLWRIVKEDLRPLKVFAEQIMREERPD